MMITPRSSSTCRITPCQISRPARVTTNDGTPTLATIVPWPSADQAGDEDREGDGDHPRIVVRAPGQLELGHREGGDAAEVADREVDLPEEEDEDDAVGEHRHARHLDDEVDEVGRREEVRRGEAEEGDDRHLADQDRQDAEVARLHVVADPLREPGVLARARLLRGGRCPGLSTSDAVLMTPPRLRSRRFPQPSSGCRR